MRKEWWVYNGSGVEGEGGVKPANLWDVDEGRI